MTPDSLFRRLIPARIASLAAFRPAGRLAFALPWILLALILAGYTVEQVLRFAPGSSEPDTSGYLIMAERMATGRPLATQEPDIFTGLSHIWVENHRGELLPKYQPGYPLLMAAGMRLAGDTGAYAISPLCGGLTIIAAFLLFRLWMSAAMAVIATLTLALNPMVLFYASFPLTHSADLCFVCWGMYFLWRWHRMPRIHWGLGAGLCLGFSVLVRPTNALLLIPALFAGAVVIFRRRIKVRPWAALLALFGAYGAVLVAGAAYNTVLFGNPMTTGYSLSNEQSAFALDYFKLSYRHVLDLMQRVGISILFPIGLAGMFCLGSRSERCLQWLWFLPTFLIYSAYYWNIVPHGCSTIRFLMCLFPLLAGAAFALIDRVPRPYRYILLLWVLAIMFYELRGLSVDLRKNKSLRAAAAVQQAAADPAARHLREDSAVFADLPVAYYLGRGKNFRLYDLDWFTPSPWRKLPSIDSTQPRWQPSRLIRCTEFRDTHSGTLKTEKQKLVGSLLDQNRQVAFIVPKAQLSQENRSLNPAYELVPAEEWTVGKTKWTLALAGRRPAPTPAPQAQPPTP